MTIVLVQVYFIQYGGAIPTNHAEAVAELGIYANFIQDLSTSSW